MAADRGGGAGLSWLRGKRVLLAEDNLTNQMVATQMLDALGARVTVANDGAEALDMLDQGFDLFLIDIEMPRVSGLDVIRTIRAAEAPLSEAPVIAVTAYALREHREKITEAGADGLIPKPLVSIEQFGRDIISHTARARAGGAGGAGGAAEGGGAQREAASAEEACPVSLSVFNGLAEAIGPEAMVDLLSKIEVDLGRAEAQVARGVAEDDRAAVAAATHVLISVAGAVGAKGLQSVAQKLNAAAHGRGDADLHDLGAQIATQLAALRSFVSSRTAVGAA
jgi:CheY-like chemotaxis protein